jgi:hypothetical protein
MEVQNALSASTYMILFIRPVNLRKYDSKVSSAVRIKRRTIELADSKAAKSSRKKQNGCKIHAHFSNRYSLLDYR